MCQWYMDAKNFVMSQRQEKVLRINAFIMRTGCHADSKLFSFLP